MIVKFCVKLLCSFWNKYRKKGQFDVSSMKDELNAQDI